MPDHVHLMIEPVIVADGVKPSAEHEISKNTACLGDGFIPSQIQRIIHDIKNKTDGVKPSAKREVDKSKFCLGDGFIPSQIQRIIHDIKGKTAFDIRRSKSINNKIWQKSFYQIQIYSEKFFNQKLTYIHENPLKSQLVKDPADYPWSSYRNIYLDVHSLIEVDRPIL
jgi:REP element-mobilizing transposase RayT